jgi:hypothetical protein
LSRLSPREGIKVRTDLARITLEGTVSTTMPFDTRALGAQGRQRLYLAAFAVFCGLVYAMALMSPEGLAEQAIFLAAAQLAALTAGLAVYAGATEAPARQTSVEVATGQRAGKEGLRESLSALLRRAETSERDLSVAVMLIEADEGISAQAGAGHAFERVKLALRSRRTAAEVIELREDCLALTLASPAAPYDLEDTAHALLRDLRNFRATEFGMASLNLTFGIGVCSGERGTVEGLVWQAQVALRRAYDLNTGIYVVSNGSSLAHKF